MLIGLIGLIGLRMLPYWRSFLFASPRFRVRDKCTTQDRKHLHVPLVKVQITTRGSAGSSEVIMRGIRSVMLAAEEDPDFYRSFLSVEVVSEPQE